MKILLFTMLLTFLAVSSPCLAEGDPIRGKKLFNKCKACHALKAGKHKIGPSLYQVIGRKAGTAAGFKRYRGLKGADWTWTEETLDLFLTNPKKFVKKKSDKRSSMLLKLKGRKDRDDVISYLKSLP